MEGYPEVLSFNAFLNRCRYRLRDGLWQETAQFTEEAACAEAAGPRCAGSLLSFVTG